MASPDSHSQYKDYCLTEGSDPWPAPASSEYTMHARNCQEQCQLIEACSKFRFWENGLCTLFDEAGTSVSLNHEGHEPNSKRLHISRANIGVFSKEEFERIAARVRASIPFYVVEDAFERMDHIWNISPGKPIHPRDFKKYGIEVSGRTQGRVIASLIHMVATMHNFTIDNSKKICIY
jgi:hypothetical protein